MDNAGEGFPCFVASENTFCVKVHVPLTEFRVVFKNMNYNDLPGDLHGGTMQVTMQDDRAEKLVLFCETPRTREEMQQHIGITNRDYFRKAYLKPLLESGQLLMTIPDKPNSRNQRYVKA